MNTTLIIYNFNENSFSFENSFFYSLFILSHNNFIATYTMGKPSAGGNPLQEKVSHPTFIKSRFS